MEAPFLVAEWGILSFRLLHPLVMFLWQGGLLLDPSLGLEAPPNVLVARSYHTGSPLAEQVRILGEPWWGELR